MEDQVKINWFDDAIRIAKGDIYSPGMWFMMFVFSAMAIQFSIYLQFQKSGKQSFFTPDKFSNSFAIINNMWRIFVGLSAMYVTFRLGGTLFNREWLQNEDLQLVFALGVGTLISFGVDRLIIQIQKGSDILKGPNPYKQAIDDIVKQQANENVKNG